jgi:hypothetical protein
MIEMFKYENRRTDVNIVKSRNRVDAVCVYII